MVKDLCAVESEKMIRDIVEESVLELRSLDIKTRITNRIRQIFILAKENYA